MLRDLAPAGFNAGREGVMMSGRTSEHQVTVLVQRKAIEKAFPKIASTSQCVAFVERNVDSLRAIVNGRLKAGTMIEFAINRGWPERAIFVELTGSNLTRSKRWFTP